jgi:phenylacetate-CoA ligase
MLTLDKQFMAGMAYYLGLRKIGCGIVRSGPGTPAAQLDIIKRHKVNVLVAVPSFLLKIISFAQSTGIDINSLGVKKIICIGEAVRNDDLSPNILATKITDHWNVQLYGTFASTEMQTAFTEDIHGDGYFLQPELLYAEILDDNNNEVAEGETGELTITHFGLEGTPLVRYRTGDICRKLSSESKSGRNTLKIGPVIGRKNQLIKLNGTTLYPNAIIQTLKEYDLDDFLVVVEKSAIQTDEVKILITSSKAVNYELMIQQLQNRLRVKPVIIHATKSELDALRPRESRKLIQVVFQ